MEENEWDKVKELGKMTESFIQKCLTAYLQIQNIVPTAVKDIKND